MKIASFLSSSASTKHTSGRPVLALGSTAAQLLIVWRDALSLLFVSLVACLTLENAAYCKACLSRNEKTCQWTFIPEEKWKVFLSFRSADSKNLPDCAARKKGKSGQEDFCFWNRPYHRNSSQVTNVSMSAPGSLTQPPLARKKLGNQSKIFAGHLQICIDQLIIFDEEVRIVDSNGKDTSLKACNDLKQSSNMHSLHRRQCFLQKVASCMLNPKRLHLSQAEAKRRMVAWTFLRRTWAQLNSFLTRALARTK